MSASDTIEQRTRRRISLRLLPFLFAIYVIAYIDRSNVSFASLEMTKDLAFSPQVFGFGAGIFFLGYFLFDIPGSLLVEFWSARKLVALIMAIWGIVATLTGLISTAHEFYLARFLLGFAEGGFFPGIIVYLSHWYRPSDRAKSAAIFMLAIPVSQIVCGPISAVLLKKHWLAIPGWRWMLLLEGAPAVIASLAALLYLTDKPSEAAWLSEPEKDWICGELHSEEEKGKMRMLPLLRVLGRRPVLILTLCLFFFQSANYGLILWLPKIVQKISGADSSTTSLLSIIPFVCGLPAMILAGWYSDRKRERLKHASFCCLFSSVALLLSLWPGLGWPLQLAMFSLAIAGLYGFNPVFYLIPAEILKGSEAAASLGFVSAVGHLGGFLGPYAVAFLVARTVSFRAGVLFIAVCAFLAAVSLKYIGRPPVRSLALPTDFIAAAGTVET